MTSPIQQADSELSEYQREEHSLSEFLDYAQDQPEAVVDSVQYIVNAIEHFGTRTVIERGEEKERYCFFDDPENDGEHAVLGNTEQLNGFVQSLKRKTREEGDNDKILWVTGPTATGKSELKRCLFNGIRAYARTEEGRRYTLEWSLDSLSGGDGLTYNDSFQDEKDWYKSPVNVNPLAVLPEKTREQFVAGLDTDYSIDIESDIDPFSNEAFQHLLEQHDSFEEAVSSEHLRVVSYVPEMGDGLGILQSEDTGDVKQKMAGSWMRDAMEEYASRGRKNAQAFTYDGLLSQGNSCVSLVEDAHHHLDLFQKLMNVCEENVVKLDNKIVMNIDTVIICLSNPDFESRLEEYEDALEADPLKSLRRRLEKYNFNYLTSVTLETQLIRKHVCNEDELWEEDIGEQFEKMAESVNVFDAHFSPHAIEAASFYSILTRLGDTENYELSKSERVLYYDRGYHVENNEKKDIEAELATSARDGLNGLPVTYTSEIISELAQENDVVMPRDVIESLQESMGDEPLFSHSEYDEFAQLSSTTIGYINKQLKKDVIEAMVDDHRPSEEDIREYVDSLFDWYEDNEEEFDSYELREFETSYMGLNPDDYGSENAEPKELVSEFRVQKIINPINKSIWNNKDEGEPEIPIEESHTLQLLLDDNDWDRVEQLYENIDISQWREPPEGSNTEELKQKTINNMVDMGYTEESAERATIRVFEVTPPNFDNDGD